MQIHTPRATTSHNHLFALALLPFPSRCVFPPFIFLAEKPLKSPLDTASPLLENLFFPPKPNFASRFWRLFEPIRSVREGLPPEELCLEESSLSIATSNRSSSCVADVSAP